MATSPLSSRDQVYQALPYSHHRSFKQTSVGQIKNGTLTSNVLWSKNATKLAPKCFHPPHFPWHPAQSITSTHSISGSTTRMRNNPKMFKFQLVLFLWEFLPCRMQCHMGWAPLCCHAAQLPQSIPHGHSNREHRGTNFLILLWEHWSMSLGWELLLQEGWKQGLWGEML